MSVNMSEYPLISVETALERVVSETVKVFGERELADFVPIRSCLGRILAENVVADRPFPVLPTSIKDGYAISSKDKIPGKFRVVGSSRAGPCVEIVNLASVSGTAVYVTTGASIPAGYDAVVEVEKTSIDAVDGNGVETISVATTGANGHLEPYTDIRKVGSDIVKGEILLRQGVRLGPAEIGVLAMIGRQNVRVWRTPCVAVLSTGDELVDGDAKLQPGEIFDANRPMLIAACEEEGARVIDLGIHRDVGVETSSDRNWLLKAIESDADILITSGGVSMGDRDLVKPAIAKSGKVHFGRMKMKPGKPTMFATLSRKEQNRSDLLVFSLPGNPVSSLVTLNLLVIPALRVLKNQLSIVDAKKNEFSFGMARIKCMLTSKIKLDPHRPEYHRATITYNSEDEIFEATTTGFQRSSKLTSMLNADTLLELPSAEEAGCAFVEKGTIVSGLLLKDLRHSSFLQSHVDKIYVDKNTLSLSQQSSKRKVNKAKLMPMNVDVEEIGIVFCTDEEVSTTAANKLCENYELSEFENSSISINSRSSFVLETEIVSLVKEKRKKIVVVVAVPGSPLESATINQAIEHVCKGRLIPGISESIRVNSKLTPSMRINDPLVDYGMSDDCAGQFEDSIVIGISSSTRLRARMASILGLLNP